MNTLASALALALLADAAPTEATRCNRGDHACHAAMYMARAEAAATPTARAKYLEAAHRSFLALHDQTRSPEALCSARRSLERTAAVLGPVAATQQLAPLRQHLEQREAIARPKCPISGSSPTRKVGNRTRNSSKPAITTPTEPTPAVQVEPPPVVATQTQPSAPPVPVIATSASPTESAVLLAVPVRHNMPRSGPDSTAPADPTPRRLIIVGGVTVGVGIGLAAVAGYAGARLAGTARDSFNLYAAHHGQGDAAALAEEDALRRDHARWLPITVTTAALGGTAAIVGAVLIAVGKRRAATVTSRAALLPIPGGLAIRARF